MRQTTKDNFDFSDKSRFVGEFLYWTADGTTSINNMWPLFLPVTLLGVNWSAERQYSIIQFSWSLHWGIILHLHLLAYHTDNPLFFLIKLELIRTDHPVLKWMMKQWVTFSLGLLVKLLFLTILTFDQHHAVILNELM